MTRRFVFTWLAILVLAVWAAWAAWTAPLFCLSVVAGYAASWLVCLGSDRSPSP